MSTSLRNIVNRSWCCCVACLLWTGLVSGAPDPPISVTPVATELIISDLPPTIESQQSDASIGWSRDEPSATGGSFMKNVIVVCPPGWLSTLSRWIEYRHAQGYRIVQVDGRLSSVDILAAIRKFARREGLDAVVIVGDADLTMADDPMLRSRCVPAFLARANVNAALGAEPHIATDNPYGDIDGDQIPDVPVGRISVDTTQQLSTYIDRVLRYESQPDAGDWRRAVHLAAAVGDFGAIADTIIESAARKFLAEGIPPAYQSTMTYGNWRSPYCPDPRLFRETMLQRVHEGSLIWVYMGHGQPHRLDRFPMGDSIVPVLEEGDVCRFQAKHGSPIAILLACYTGAFEQPSESLAEMMLRNPQGPLAVFASSRVTMPYSMAILGTSLMQEFFETDECTLGNIILRGKQSLASENGGQNRKLMDSLAKTFSPTKEQLPEERREHQLLFNLFGDPLIQIPKPRQLTVECPPEVDAGQSLVFRGAAPFAGTCTAELVCRRDQLRFSPAKRRLADMDDRRLEEMNAVYRQANDSRWCQRRFDIQTGRFAVELNVPAQARGECHVRIAIENSSDYAIGAADVLVRDPSERNDLRVSNANR